MMTQLYRHSHPRRPDRGYKTMFRARQEISRDQVLDSVTCDRDQDNGGGSHPEIVRGGAGNAQIPAGA